MSESGKKEAPHPSEKVTIKEGETFKQASLPKVVNLDDNLKKSYP